MWIFLSGKAQFLTQKQRAWHHPLVKALGISPHGPTLHILDATAGLGQDAWLMHLLGAQLTLLERHPLPFMLLQDALRRAELEESLPLWLTDVHHWFSQEIITQRYDVIYLDPMFPKRRKGAPNKGMYALQTWVGSDEDSAYLLPWLQRYVHRRVVVKRPRQAPVLRAQPPHHCITGRSTRFDVYAPLPH